MKCFGGKLDEESEDKDEGHKDEGNNDEEYVEDEDEEDDGCILIKRPNAATAVPKKGKCYGAISGVLYLSR